jgi:membrane protease YdiL (CAAX protease family)
VLAQLPNFWRALEVRGPGTALGWAAAIAVAICAIVYTVRALDLQRYLTTISWFRALGPIIAVPSALLEEAFFRMMLMNFLEREQQNLLVQILASAIAFGAVHAVWSIRGRFRSLVTSVTATSVLGALLAIVYLAMRTRFGSGTSRL